MTSTSSRSWSFVMCALFVALFAGCEAAPDSDVLEVSSVTPESIASGGVVTLRGMGFPTGADGEVTLSGTLRRPDDEATVVSAVATLRARSPSEATFSADDPGLAPLRRGTFEGSLRARFQGREGAVAGSIEGVQLHFLADSSGELAEDLARTRRASALLEALGLSVVDPGSAGGLVIESVNHGSRSAQAGLHKGDRVIAVDGMQIDTLGDFAPPRGATVTELTVLRDALRRRVYLDVDLAPRGALPGSDAIVLGALLALLMLPLLRSRAAPEASSSAGLLATFVGCALALAVPLAMLTPVDALAVGLCVAVLHAAIAPRRAATRARAFERAGRTALPVIVAVVASAAFAGTFSIHDIVARQGPLPFEWIAFRDPAAFLALLASVACLSAGPADNARRGEAARVVRLLVSGLLTTLLLGGVSVGGEDPVSWTLAAALFVAKTLLLVTLAERAGGLLARPVAPYALAALALGAEVAWLALVPAETREGRVLGEVVTFAVALLLVALLLRAITERGTRRGSTPQGVFESA